MCKIKSQRMGAHVLERLSLATQCSIARTITAGQSFTPEQLAALGQIDRNTEFLKLYGTRITLPELVGILNHVDRHTERRLVLELESSDPDCANAIKQNMFVFEDLVLLDAKAIHALAAELAPDTLATAMMGTNAITRAHILSGLDERQRQALAPWLKSPGGTSETVKLAQEAVIDALRQMEESGRLIVSRNEEGPGGQVQITVT